jgi:hypothetical protein
MTKPFYPPLSSRELRWLRHIALHGPQSSEFLLELCADTHKCRDTGLRTLQKLREQGYLRLPPQQRQIAKADFNPHVYDLTRQAELHLRGLGDPDTIRPTGHWWHGFYTACITSAIDIAAQRKGQRYIPAHVILNRTDTTLAIPHGRQKIIPDQLFAIKTPQGFRSYVLEVDRGTEPLQSKTARKSLRRSLEHYADLHGKDAIRKHYGLKSPLLFLYVFTNPARAAACIGLVEKFAPTLSKLLCVQVVDGVFPRFQVYEDAVSAQWRRVCGPLQIL